MKIGTFLDKNPLHGKSRNTWTMKCMVPCMSKALQTFWCIEHVCTCISSLCPIQTNRTYTNEPLLTQSVLATINIIKTLKSCCTSRVWVLTPPPHPSPFETNFLFWESLNFLKTWFFLWRHLTSHDVIHDATTSHTNPWRYAYVICLKWHDKFFYRWPCPLTYDVALWTCPRYHQGQPLCQISWLYAKRFIRESANRHTDREMDRPDRYSNLDC